jgi:hypothetical protein
MVRWNRETSPKSDQQLAMCVEPDSPYDKTLSDIRMCSSPRQVSSVDLPVLKIIVVHLMRKRAGFLSKTIYYS